MQSAIAEQIEKDKMLLSSISSCSSRSNTRTVQLSRALSDNLLSHRAVQLSAASAL